VCSSCAAGRREFVVRDAMQEEKEAVWGGAGQLGVCVKPVRMWTCVCVCACTVLPPKNGLGAPEDGGRQRTPPTPVMQTA